MNPGVSEAHYRFRNIQGATGVGVLQRPGLLARAVDSSEASAGLLHLGSPRTIAPSFDSVSRGRSGLLNRRLAEGSQSLGCWTSAARRPTSPTSLQPSQRADVRLEGPREQRYPARKCICGVFWTCP
jgi:hypothetical protein